MYERKTVLISEPQLMEMGLPYLPIMWGILKTHWEAHHAGDEFEWLAPISQPDTVETILSGYGRTPIDVLGLSCYTWNWTLQSLLAKAVKARYPNCIVVAGGPDPDYKDEKFFRKHPYIDMIAVRDGEITFNKILERIAERPDQRELLRDRNAFADIPGLYLPNVEFFGHRNTGGAQVPTDFATSPYLGQSAFYEKLRANLGADIIAVWETNRGCPYRCSFCDWGSSTMSKLRRFDMDRLRAEVEWFAAMKVSFVMLADANFGILERDLELTELLIKAHEQYAYPKCFSYNTAKNNPNRTVAIARKLVRSGLMSTHVLSIQHTDPGVLAATERDNISIEKQYQVTRQLRADGVPIYVQLILGIPGDKPSSWRKCFADLMDLGLHGPYFVFPYSLLPNAPAAEPAYMQRWEIETEDRYVLLNHGERKPGPFDPIKETKSRLIVSTRTFSRADWIEMNGYTAFIKALHNSSLTHSIAVYLRHTHAVGYNEFYSDLFDEFFIVNTASRKLYEAIRAQYRYYLETADAVAFMDLPQFPGFEYQIEPGHWLFIQLCLQFESWFEALAGYLAAKYSHAANLSSAVKYQKNLVILPSYDRKAGKMFAAEHDWPAYFHDVQSLSRYAPLPEPREVAGGVIMATDSTYSDEGVPLPLDWGRGNEDSRWRQWIHTMGVGNSSSGKNNLQQLRLQQFDWPFGALALSATVCDNAPA